MPRPELEFERIEGDILIALYESPEGLSSYELIEKQNPSTTSAHVSRVIEQHYADGLIRGNQRSKNADGIIVFKKLKLTPQGVRAAIRERVRRVEQENVALMLDVADAMRKQESIAPIIDAAIQKRKK